MGRDWSTFLLPYEQAVNELKIKLRALRTEFLEKGEHTPIEFVTGRVKPVPSIIEKMHRRVIEPALLEEDMQDRQLVARTLGYAGGRGTGLCHE
jgi:putative GTP pyrophosphokinase